MRKPNSVDPLYDGDQLIGFVDRYDKESVRVLAEVCGLADRLAEVLRLTVDGHTKGNYCACAACDALEAYDGARRP